MVVIRLARGGMKKRPFYRIVVSDNRSPRDGKFLEKLGTYNPLLPKDSPERIKLDTERAAYWLSVGAQPTDRVARFLDAAGLRTRAAKNNPNKGEPGAKAKERVEQFVLPTDNIVATPVDSGKKDKKGRPKMDLTSPRVNSGDSIPDHEEGVDIGPATAKNYAAILASAKTVLWNGPMGIFEDPRFAEGTFAVAKAVAEATQKGAKSIIGGGDSVKAINKAKLGDQVTFMSTGGGASLEFLEGQVLPGVAALQDK